MMDRRHRVGIVLLAAALFASGCYGPFRLTKRLYTWNGQVGDKWANELVFLILLVVPVYSFATLADGIVLNSIEFWTGTNPMASDPSGATTRRIARGSDEAVLTRQDGASGKAMTVALFHDGQSTGTVRFEQAGAGQPTLVKDAQGRLLMSAQAQPDGGLVVSRGNGQQVARYTPTEVEQIIRKARLQD